jgi:hypothetical protein
MRFEKTRQALVTITASALIAAGLVSFGPATTATPVGLPATVQSVRAAEGPSKPVQVKKASRSITRTAPPQKKNIVVKKKVQKKVEKRKPTKVKAIASNSGVNRRIGRAMAAERGWTGNQWTCLNNLWTKESGWRTEAVSRSGKHHGIPQILSESLRGASAEYQIKRGLSYIDHRYGTPCSAWGHFQSHNWY